VSTDVWKEHIASIFRVEEIISARNQQTSNGLHGVMGRKLIIFMRKNCHEKIGLVILMDLHDFSPAVSEKVVLGILSVCMYVHLDSAQTVAWNVLIFGI
jgi:hypothetical protein